jgi:hypothetical protein
MARKVYERVRLKGSMRLRVTALLPANTWWRSAVLRRIRAGEESGEEHSENGLDAKEAAADHTEVHLDHHQSPDNARVPLHTRSGGSVKST